jgi:hypothetical protein
VEGAQTGYEGEDAGEKGKDWCENAEGEGEGVFVGEDERMEV